MTTTQYQNDDNGAGVTDTGSDAVVDTAGDSDDITDPEHFRQQVESYKMVKPTIYGFDHDEISTAIKVQRDYLIKTGFTTKTGADRVLEWKRQHGYDCIQQTFGFTPEIAYVDDNGNTHTTYAHDTAFHKLLREQGKCEQCDNIKYTRLVDFPKNVLDGISEAVKVNAFVPSREFYVKTCVCSDDITPPITEDLLDGFMKNEILDDYKKHVADPAHKPHYTYFTEQGRFMKKELHFTAEADFSPRDYQRKAYESIANKINSGQSDVLLWSPARSGKSVIAAWAMNELCGVGDLVVVVSGITDVMIEWQETIEGHVDFGKVDSETGKKRFAFLNASMIKGDANAVDNAFKTADNVVMFLSQQDLAGSHKNGIKEHHRQLLNDDGSTRVSYVLADECHFGAFSPTYGASIHGTSEDVTDAEISELKDTIEDIGYEELTDIEDDEDRERANKAFYGLEPSKGRVFISATPFNLVASGVFSTVQSANNIVLVTPQEMIAESTQWREDNPDAPEWMNPSFGMLEKLFFGITVGDPTTIFKPVKRKFEREGKMVTETQFQLHEQAEAILQSLFSSFEGRKNKKVINFFSNPDFLRTGAGRHGLFVLPQKASCDVAERVITGILKALGIEHEYEIINISPKKHVVDGFGKKSVGEIKDAISAANHAGKKTITLTVRKMVTGVSVPEWDTVVMLFSGASAQLQEQIMGRPNTPWTSTVEVDDEDGELDDKGDVKTRKDKIANKQVSAIIHFAPETVYGFMNDMQWIADRADDAGTDNIDDDDDENTGDAIEPMRMFTSMFDVRGGTISKLTMVDIRSIVLNDLANKGAHELINKHIRFDVSAIDDNVHMLNTLNSLDIVGEKKANKTETEQFELDEEESQKTEDSCIVSVCMNNRLSEDDELCDTHRAAAEQAQFKKDSGEETDEEDEQAISEVEAEWARRKEEEEARREEIKKKITSLMLAVSIYTVLSPCNEYSLNDISTTLKADAETEDIVESQRIANVLDITIDRLNLLKMVEQGASFDHVLHLLRDMLSDAEATEGMTKFEKLSRFTADIGSISSNEVFTPKWLAGKMVANLNDSDEDYVNMIADDNNHGFIDSAGKSGVFEVSLYERAVIAIENIVGDVHTEPEAMMLEQKLRLQKLHSIPTSAVTNEIVQKTYRDYGFNTDNIIFADDYDNIADTGNENNWSYLVVKSSELIAKRREAITEYIHAVGVQEAIESDLADAESLPKSERDDEAIKSVKATLREVKKQLRSVLSMKAKAENDLVKLLGADDFATIEKMVSLDADEKAGV